MAIFNDLMNLASGAIGVGVGTQMLTQGGGGTTTTRNFTPGPSSAESGNLQLAQAIQLANLQQAGYDMTRGDDGSITLTPRATQQPGALAGLEREFGGIQSGGGPPMSQLGGVLNTQALSGATGRPQINRQALIQAIQQKRGPQQATGLGLQAPGPTPITVGPMSSQASFAGMPSGGGLGQQGGGGSSFMQNLPLIVGGGAAGLGLLSQFGPSALNSLKGFFGGSSQPEQQATYSPTDPYLFDSLQSPVDNWYWVPDDISTNFADLGFGFDVNP